MTVDSFNHIPPYGIVRNWLGSKAIEGLLVFAQSNELLFKEADVGYGESARVDHSCRRSTLLSKLDHLEHELEAKLQNLVPGICERLGRTPFIPSKFELELVAHGDGAFFCRHVDTFIKEKRLTGHRIISAVYYFHVLPRAFVGGALRLHSLAASGKRGTFVDIEPDCDTLVFFPSWFPHEVLPVQCPSRRFIDSRFAINCWIHAKDVQRLVRHSAIPWMAATLDGIVAGTGAVFEAKFMLPWSFSEEAAVEKHMPQLQHNMWVTHLKSAVLSIITGGGKWVEITVPMDPLYLSVMVSAEKKFWRCGRPHLCPPLCPLHPRRHCRGR